MWILLWWKARLLLSRASGTQQSPPMIVTSLAPRGCSRGMQRSSISSMDSTVVTSDPAEEPLYSRIDHSSSTESQPPAVHHLHHHHHDGKLGAGRRGRPPRRPRRCSPAPLHCYANSAANQRFLIRTRIDFIWLVQLRSIDCIFVTRKSEFE